MNDELLMMLEREVFGCRISKATYRGVPGQDGFWVPSFTVYRLGRRQIGHIHDTGVAKLTFPRKIHDELISDSRAKPHGAKFPDVVSYHIWEPDDMLRAIDFSV